MWFLMLGFQLGLSPMAALLTVITTNLAMVIPSSPSGFGVFETATLVALGSYGVTDSRALSYALVLHAVNFIPYVLIGLFLLRGSLRVHSRG
jgi:uncharacterized membrane protein YbhN (UPF0104 family)